MNLDIWIPAILVYFWFGYHFSDTLIQLSTSVKDASTEIKIIVSIIMTLIWPVTFIMLYAIKAAKVGVK